MLLDTPTGQRQTSQRPDVVEVQKEAEHRGGCEDEDGGVSERGVSVTKRGVSVTKPPKAQYGRAKTRSRRFSD